MSDAGQSVHGETFSTREIEILSLMSRGHSDKQIAADLILSVQTVKWYNKRIYGKLGVKNRTQAAAAARASGLLPAWTPLGPDTALSSLPAELTSFIGRRREMDEIVRQLATARLLTLTGPGGSGKTRLSLQVARAVSENYADGVVFAPLAATTDVDLVPETIAHALGIEKEIDHSPLAGLKRALASREMLLLLDNFEHMMAAAPLVAKLLAAAPRLTVLVTSREILRLSGEQEYQVPPLLLPVAALAPSLADLARNESVALFVQRARAADHNFRLSAVNAADVAAICRRLDGLPLAIELAAARIKLFSVEQLLERLENRLGILTGGMKDMPARQRTLRDTLDWSYNLLPSGEQMLFARLGVFRGGAKLAAVEAICGPGLPIDVLDGLQSLLDKSLLYGDLGEGGERRFLMLETIHEYARKRLANSAEEAALKERQLRYYLELAEGAEKEMWGPRQLTLLQQLDGERDNLRAALDWSGRAPQAVEAGLRLAAALGLYWDLRCYYHEGRGYLSTLLSKTGPAVSPAVRAKALYEAGRLAYAQGDYGTARDSITQSLSVFRALGQEHRLALAHVLRMLGDTEVAMGNYAIATSYLQEALQIMEALRDKEGTARALWQLGWCLMNAGEVDQADLNFQRSLRLCREIGDKASLAMALSGAGELAVRQGHFQRAKTLLEESLDLNRQIDHPWGIAAALGTLGWAALLQNRLQRAAELIGQSLDLRREVQDAGGIAWCLERLAEIVLAAADQEPAPLEEAAYQRAAGLYAAAGALRDSSNSAISSLDQAPYESDLALIKGRLDPSAFEAAWERGRTMALQDLVTYALDQTFAHDRR